MFLLALFTIKIFFVVFVCLFVFFLFVCLLFVCRINSQVTCTTRHMRLSRDNAMGVVNGLVAMLQWLLVVISE